MLDAGVDFGIGEFGEFLFVEFGKVIEHLSACRGGVTGRVGEVENRVADGHEFHAGVFGREEAGSPEAIIEGLAVGSSGATGDHGDEIGEVFVFGPEAVAEPRSHGGASGDLGAGLEKGDGGVVVDGLGVHRPDEADVVSDTGDMGKEFGDFSAGLAVFFEFVFGAGDGEGFLARGHAGFSLVEVHEVSEFPAVVFLEFWFVVEEVLGGGRPGLEEVDHAFRLGLGRSSWFFTKTVAQHGGEGGDTDAGGGLAEKVASVDEKLGLGKGIGHDDDWREVSIFTRGNTTLVRKLFVRFFDFSISS